MLCGVMCSARCSPALWELLLVLAPLEMEYNLIESLLRKQVSCGAVYSLHKSSTRVHIQRTADKELCAASSEVLAQLRFDLPASYAFHRCGSCHMHTLCRDTECISARVPGYCMHGGLERLAVSLRTAYRSKMLVCTCTSITQDSRRDEASQSDFRCAYCAGTKSEMSRWIYGASQSLEQSSYFGELGWHGRSALQESPLKLALVLFLRVK